MRLKYQLFITLLIASALLVAVMFLVSSLTFSRGFLGYINDADDESLYALVQKLEQQYATDGSWDNTASNPSVLKSVLRSTGANRNKRSNKKPSTNRPATLGSTANGGRPPASNNRLHRRLVLTDANKQTLLGRIDKKSAPKWKKINHKDEIVGYVGLNRLKRLDNQFDQAFERQQKKTFALAGLSMVLLSALLAAPLASRIVKPILKVSKTVKEISDGNYAHRITTNRHDEIGNLAKDINKLGETLEKNRDSRQRHFAEISHELRTPVAVLQAELEALQDGIRKLDHSSVNSLHSETVKLKGLIEDLHTLSLADAGALDYQMQPIDFAGLVKAQINKLNAKSIDLVISLHAPEDPLFINADKQRLVQLIDNLTQNSLRYTHTPGTVHIAITAKRNTVLFSWADSAPGVTTEALDKIFDPLYRAEKSRNREHGGSGLGLSIVKKIVDAHNGTCIARHAKQGGLEITIEFPSAGLQ